MIAMDRMNGMLSSSTLFLYRKRLSNDEGNWNFWIDHLFIGNFSMNLNEKVRCEFEALK